LQDYDISFKFLSGKFPVHFINLIFDGFQGEVTPQDRELPSIRRESDYLVRVKNNSSVCDDAEFIVHMEFQSSIDVNMPARMLSYFTRIFERYKLPVHSVVIYLNPDNAKNNIPDTFVHSINGKENLTFKYEILKLWEIDQNKIIDNNLYGLFPILPLAKYRTADEKENLAKCFDLVQKADIENDTLKADIYVCTGLLAGLRYPKELIDSLMKVEILEESVIYKDILNKGIEKGMEKGMEKGIEKGMEKSIIIVLSTRFNDISPNLIDLIYRTKNESQLNKLLEIAINSNSLSEFEREIQNT